MSTLYPDNQVSEKNVPGSAAAPDKLFLTKKKSDFWKTIRPWQCSCPRQVECSKKQFFLRNSSAPGSAVAQDKWLVQTRKVGILRNKFCPRQRSCPRTSGLFKKSPIFEKRFCPRQRNCPRQAACSKQIRRPLPLQGPPGWGRRKLIPASLQLLSPVLVRLRYLLSEGLLVNHCSCLAVSRSAIGDRRITD